jgi:hypothetical protein
MDMSMGLRSGGISARRRPVAFSADFAAGVYVINGRTVTLGDATNYSRSGSGNAENLSGVFSAFGANAERLTNKGILLEPAASNGIRTPDMAGANPATEAFPTNWSTWNGGLTLTVEETGSALGFTYLRFRLQGTAAGNNGFLIHFEENTQITAAQWQWWVNSCFMRLAAGNLTAINNLRLNLVEKNSGGSDIATWYGSQIKGVIDGNWRRFQNTNQLTQATVAAVRPHLEGSFSAGASIDFQIDLAMPQTEQGGKGASSMATSPIKGSRSADALQLNLGAGTRPLTLVFDDDTTQTVPDVAGGSAYTVNPANLDRPWVKRAVWGSV